MNNETRRCEWCREITQGPCGCPAEIEIERLKRLSKEHVDSADCWCGPEVNYVDPETGATVSVHREIN